MVKRSKNIEPGCSPLGLSCSLESEFGVEAPKRKQSKKPFGELEFSCCDMDFIDNVECEHSTVRDELYYPSAGEIAFGNQASAEITQATELNHLKTVGLEGIVGDDDRIRVPNTLDANYPWSRKICSLIVTTRAGQRLKGTGWIAGERLVMTAGHNLFLHNRGGWARSVQVIPARNGRHAPFDSFTVTAGKLITTRGWKERQELSSDVGGIVIPSEYSTQFIPQIGFFAIRALDDATLRRARTNIVGYPVRVYPVGSQWWHGRRVLPELGERTFRYNIDTTVGQSGSPAFVLHNGERFVIGIHNVDVGRFNQAVRVNSEVLEKIREWKQIANDDA